MYSVNPDDDIDMSIDWSPQLSEEIVKYDLSILNKTHYLSKFKTCFWRLGCLIIFHIDNTITRSQFIRSAKLILRDFTKNQKDIEYTTTKVLRILNFINANTPLKSKNNKNGDYIRTVTPEQTQTCYNIVFERLMTYPPPNIVELTAAADFGLVSRIQLAIFAVVLDMGFSEFERAVRTEINSLRRNMKKTLPVYKWCNNFVLNNAIYLTNNTYLIMSDSLYSVVREFIDKI